MKRKERRIWYYGASGRVVVVWEVGTVSPGF